MRRGGPRDQSINYYAINENKNKLKKIYKRNKKKKMCTHSRGDGVVEVPGTQ